MTRQRPAQALGRVWAAWLAVLLLSLLGLVGTSGSPWVGPSSSAGGLAMTAHAGPAMPCHEAAVSTDASHGVPVTGHAASPACCVAACLTQCTPLLPMGPWAGFASARTPLPGQDTVHYVSVVHRPPLPPPQNLVSI